MQLTNKQQVLEKAEKLAELIKRQEEVQFYQVAEKKIKDHPRIQELISDIKKKQQELVNAKHLKKKNYIAQLEADLENLNNELHAIPLVYQYQQSQKDMNKFVHSLIKILKDQLSNQIQIDGDNDVDPKLNKLANFKL